MTLVSFHDVYKDFAGQILLDGVNFSINKSEITTLIGQNGAGKTTIAKLILGVEKPSKGTVRMAKSSKIGYVPQKLDYSANMPITCGALLNLLAPSANSAEVSELKDFIDIKDINKKSISDMSGGMFQKLLVACTILSKPDLIIFDEPTQFLDLVSQQKFYQLINKIKDEKKTTIFIISHDLFTVMKNTDQVICLNKHVCCSGKPSDMYENQGMKSALSEIGLYIHHHDHKH